MESAREPTASAIELATSLAPIFQAIYRPRMPASPMIITISITLSARYPVFQDPFLCRLPPAAKHNRDYFIDLGPCSVFYLTIMVLSISPAFSASFAMALSASSIFS